MGLEELLDQQTILVRLKGNQKQEVIEELVDALNTSCKIDDCSDVLNAVLEREKIMSTGIGKGVAIPHGKTDSVDSLVGVLGIKKEGIDFQSLDEQPVYLFFLLISPLNVSGPHIRALAHISRLLRNDNLRKDLIASENPNQTLELIKTAEGKM